MRGENRARARATITIWTAPRVKISGQSDPQVPEVTECVCSLLIVTSDLLPAAAEVVD